MYFTLLGTKTPKSIENILYGERKADFQKRVFRVFESVLGNETLKNMESPL